MMAESDDKSINEDVNALRKLLLEKIESDDATGKRRFLNYTIRIGEWRP